MFEDYIRLYKLSCRNIFRIQQIKIFFIIKLHLFLFFYKSQNSTFSTFFNIFQHFHIHNFILKIKWITKKNLKLQSFAIILEKLFYITFIVATSIYSISFISFLIMTGFINRNYQFIFLLIFPIIITVIYRKFIIFKIYISKKIY